MNRKFFIVIFPMTVAIFIYSIQYGVALPTNKQVPPRQILIFDNSSVPIVDYGYINGTYIGLQRNPVAIAQAAMHFYEIYNESGSQTARTSLINNANWLVGNAVPRGNYSVFEYKFPYPIYDMKPLWHSGMAQGQAVDALVKAYKVTGASKYLDIAKKILNSFFVGVENGGVTYKTPEDGWWYEEYASIDGKHPRVLNGMMYTLLGIYSYYDLTHDANAKYIFDQGVLSLKTNLPRYDAKGYSYYDILGKPANQQYQRVHIDLLQKLYAITGQEIFKLYHDKWKNQII